MNTIAILGLDSESLAALAPGTDTVYVVAVVAILSAVAAWSLIATLGASRDPAVAQVAGAPLSPLNQLGPYAIEEKLGNLEGQA